MVARIRKIRFLQRTVSNAVKNNEKTNEKLIQMLFDIVYLFLTKYVENKLYRIYHNKVKANM